MSWLKRGGGRLSPFKSLNEDSGDRCGGFHCLEDYGDAFGPRGRGSRARQHQRLLRCAPQVREKKMDLADKESIDKLFAEEKFDKVVNLAAQAGVRYSITNPYAYMQSNMVGFLKAPALCVVQFCLWPERESALQ